MVAFICQSPAVWLLFCSVLAFGCGGGGLVCVPHNCDVHSAKVIWLDTKTRILLLRAGVTLTLYISPELDRCFTSFLFATIRPSPLSLRAWNRVLLFRLRVHVHLPSLLMPRARHFCKRQCWQRLRLVRSIRQFLWREHEYMALFCWLRRKKPCTRRVDTSQH